MEMSFEDEAGWEGLRAWAESREAQARRTGRIRVTAGILTQEHVGAVTLTRPAERSSSGRQASDVGPETPDVNPRPSGVGRQTSGLGFATPNSL